MIENSYWRQRQSKDDFNWRQRLRDADTNTPKRLKHSPNEEASIEDKKDFYRLRTMKEIGTDAPERFKLLPHGEVQIEDDDAAFMDPEGADLIIEYFKGLSHDMVIDYEHQTLSGNRAPAAGWINQIDWQPSDGLYVKVAWTREATEYIKKREYRYFSPVLLVRKSDRKIVRLYNVALTNQPKMKNIQALVSKENFHVTGGETMQGKEESAGQIICKKVAAFLNDPAERAKYGVLVDAQYSYGDAMNIVCSNNPILAETYLQQSR